MVSPADVSDSLMRHLLFMFCSPRLPLPHGHGAARAEFGEFAPFGACSTARLGVGAPPAWQLAAATARRRSGGRPQAPRERATGRRVARDPDHTSCGMNRTRVRLRWLKI